MSAAPATDLRLHYREFLFTLNQVLDPVKAYRFGEVPGADGNGDDDDLPDRYAVVDVQRRPYTPQSMAAHPDVSGWAVSVVGVGREVDEAAWVLDRIAHALEDSVITLDGETSTPLTFDTSGPITRDGRVFEGLITFTYVL